MIDALAMSFWIIFSPLMDWIAGAMVAAGMFAALFWMVAGSILE